MKYEFTIEELKTISRIMDKQYIPYDDTVAHEVLRRIDSIIREEANHVRIDTREVKS